MKIVTCALEIRVFDVIAGKRRMDNRSLYGINEDPTTVLTQLTRKKTIFN